MFSVKMYTLRQAGGKKRAKLKTTQYKKLAPKALRFIYQNLKSCKPHKKNKKKQHQNTRFIDEKLKTKSLMFFGI